MIYGSMYGTNNSTSFNPDYAYPDVAFVAVQEAAENEQKLFDIIIEKDFLEAAVVVNESYGSELRAVNEGFASNIWEKVIESLKKAWEIIKSAATAAKTKIGAFFTKDNAALVEKYGSQFDDASDKVMIKNFKSFNQDALSSKIDSIVDSFDEGWNNAINKLNSAGTAKDARKVASDKDFSIKTLGGGSDAKKKFLKEIFGREKEVKLGTIKSEVRTTLTNAQNSLNSIDDIKNSWDEKIQSYLDQADKYKDDASNKTGQEKDLWAAKGAACNTIANNIKSVGSSTINWGLDAIKENIKQCRKAFIKGATSVNVKEIIKDSANVIMIEAMMDADDINTDSFFDQYSYDYNELVG